MKRSIKKLVRDKIPEVIKNKGEKPTTSIITNDNLYLSLLYEKLLEEVNEFISDKSTFEAADVMEVLATIISLNSNYSIDEITNEIMNKMLKKRAEKGSFTERIYLDFIEGV